MLARFLVVAVAETNGGPKDDIPGLIYRLDGRAVRRNRIRLRPYSVRLAYGSYPSRTRTVIIYLSSSTVRYG
jgi:hypothetical protein